MTLLCNTSHLIDPARILFIQIGKMAADGSFDPLVELILGGQRPMFVDDDFMSRASVDGTMSVWPNGAFIKVRLSRKTGITIVRRIK